ncbi:MAG: sulfite exporter TauE/SafE family protein [Candidatus Diapherotrites archaeon]|nr:sulfite exporter TauE/SafE family protein [Candidatus Diapherotrites archaeon]
MLFSRLFNSKREMVLMKKNLWQYALTGIATGFASSFLGIGGGIILVPALLAMKFNIKKAVGTSLAVLVVVSLVGAATHFVIDPESINFFAVFVLLIGALLGSKIGSELIKKIHSKALAIMFYLLLIFVSLKMLGVFESFLQIQINDASIGIIVFILTGLLGGLSSTLFGIGGGAIYVPMLSDFFGFPIQAAVATSIATIFGTSIFGAFFHKKGETIDFIAAKTIIIFGFVSAIIGTFASKAVSAPDLKIIFGLFLLGVVIVGLINFGNHE